MRLNWARFLGSDGNGFSASTNAPESWDAKTGAGIVWKVPSPAHGFNSPIVWGGRVFISGGDAKRREVVCLDAKTGAVMWRQEIANVPGSPAQPPEIPESTGFAAPTMATDGRRVYVIFANGDVAALTMDGKIVWSKSFGPLKNPYGHATSLATWQDKLILQLDQGDSEDGKSRLIALDGKTGKIAWQKARHVGSSWASPTIFEAAGKTQIVLLSIPWAMSHSATDGTELWKVDCLNGEVTPTPIFADGKVIVASPSDKVIAIAPDGQGDVTKTKVLWTNEDNVPDVTSPASNGELVFTLTTSGFLTCLDIKDGKKQWEHDFETECHASPTILGNRVFVLSQKGTAVLVEAARAYKELLRTEIPDAFHASPAFAGSSLFLRGVTNVWCLGRK
jgi:outer membrane protein assembly factor BamB